MSGRWWRRKRWEQWNRRPATRALASRSRRERYTNAEIDAVADTSMDAGVTMGRRFGERDLFRALADDFVLREDATPEDVLDLAAYIGGKALAQEVDTFLTVERAWRADPDTMGRIAEAVELGGEEGKQALEAIAREMGVFPDDSVPPADDLLDVATAAGVLDGDEDQALWDSVPNPGETVVVEIEQWLRDRGRWLEGGA